jgi:hypothetical protein
VTQRWSSQDRDPAATVAPRSVLNNGPIGVPTLTEAAALLQLELAEVERAAEHMRPWLCSEGRQLWSLRQLARRVAQARSRHENGS